MRRGIPRRVATATALVATLALAATACGDDSGDSGDKKGSGPVTITWWDTSNATNEAPTYKALISEFEAANKDIKVKYVNVPFDQAQDKFQTAAGSKGAPDVLRSEVGWTASFAKSQFLAPLDGTPALDQQEDFTPALLKQAQYQGKTYGAPIVTDTLALMWNKELLKKAGHDKAPATWDELKTVAKDVKAKAGVDGFWLNNATYYELPFLFGEGTDMVDAAGKKITINSPEAVKAVDASKDLLASDGVAKLDVTADAYAHMMDGFNNGKVAMIVQGPWELTNIYKGKSFADKTNLGISNVPAGSSGKAGAPTGGHNLSIYAGSPKDKQEAAQKFVGFMTSGKTQAQIALKNGTLPTRTSAYTDEVKAAPGVADFQQVLSSSSQPRPDLPEYSTLLGDAFAQNLTKILQGKTSTQDGLDTIAGEFKKLVPDFS
ncbi:putative ABC transporter-binding protein [Streptomyces sp. RB5]|uniref:Putative ABC transporter-binding protein n=1 Tax=Streptomyces smaragdinus TaxID=2585196 RepID=A0A7K0CMQ0_9ACTN|nr:extracellular solute-binding protein [Streptomyces smaragdinus]MQY14756.1 putative ABC transporter-binding protein [Streptomyces smaragdinus]